MQISIACIHFMVTLPFRVLSNFQWRNILHSLYLWSYFQGVSMRYQYLNISIHEQNIFNVKVSMHWAYSPNNLKVKECFLTFFLNKNLKVFYCISKIFLCNHISTTIEIWDLTFLNSYTRVAKYYGPFARVLVLKYYVPNFIVVEIWLHKKIFSKVVKIF